LEVAVTTHPGHAREMACAAARRDLLLVAGGDGTINEAVNGLSDAFPGGTPPAAMAILPVGTGNSLHREIGLSMDPVRAAAQLRSGSVRTVHLGDADGRLFTLMVGTGFDGYVVPRIPYRLKRWAGRFSYVMMGAASLLRYGYPMFRVRVDGKPYEVSSAVVSKSSHYGGAMRIAPDASLHRPELDVCLFFGRGALRYSVYTLGVLLQRHTRFKDVRYLKAQEVVIEPSGRAVPSQMDGEALPHAPSMITVSPIGLKMLMPG
jgi:YegS/Rv2252/BmrU family lipid kinase